MSSFAIIQLRKRELVALLCVLAVVWLLVLYVSSSWCLGWSVVVAVPGLHNNFGNSLHWR